MGRGRGITADQICSRVQSRQLAGGAGGGRAALLHCKPHLGQAQVGLAGGGQRAGWWWERKQAAAAAARAAGFGSASPDRSAPRSIHGRYEDHSRAACTALRCSGRPLAQVRRGLLAWRIAQQSHLHLHACHAQTGQAPGLRRLVQHKLRRGRRLLLLVGHRDRLFECGVMPRLARGPKASILSVTVAAASRAPAARRLACRAPAAARQPCRILLAWILPQCSLGVQGTQTDVSQEAAK